MTDNPAWIRLVPYDESEGYLRTLYDRVKGPGGKIDNVMRAHSLRPHTMEGHSALYKSVLHHTGNSMPVWFLECLAVYTSLSNRCDYSVAHHFAGLSRLLQDEARAGAIYKAFAATQPERVFDGKELALLRYVAVDDCGVVLDHALADAQVMGGAAQGIGQALMERVAYDDASGQLITGSFMDYAMPRAADIPSFAGALLSTPTALNPLGAKAVGEAGPTAAPPAVVAAILDALAPLGVRHIDMPATPETVWRAIRAASGAG
jgi:xanthine dehydrogenase molybdopterin-binding subunit B